MKTIKEKIRNDNKIWGMKKECTFIIWGIIGLMISFFVWNINKNLSSWIPSFSGALVGPKMGSIFLGLFSLFLLIYGFIQMLKNKNI